VTASEDATIRVESLSADYWDRPDWINVVSRVSFSIYPGETLGLAGESGCGKTTTASALFGYRRPGSRFREGSVYFEGQDLLRLDERELRHIRGGKISMVPQNPAGSLTPSMRVGQQIVETMETHGACSGRRDAEKTVIRLFNEVGLPQPEALIRRYPHQLSGGQQQRVIIAMALSCNPSLLVLDEPTSALDVTIQARILNLLVRLQAEYGMGALFVTHDLGVLAQVCDRVAIMYAGEMVEIAPTRQLYHHPRHPYTRGLIAVVPRVSEQTSTEERLHGLLRREDLPQGCRFAPRCNYARPECFVQPQTLTTIAPDHQVACWRWDSIGERTVGKQEVQIDISR
jgi:oligopeptide/dipeptide ABC transporter ATP-binding protein